MFILTNGENKIVKNKKNMKHIKYEAPYEEDEEDYG